MSVLDLRKAISLGVPIADCTIFIDTGCGFGDGLGVAREFAKDRNRIALPNEPMFETIVGIDISPRNIGNAAKRFLTDPCVALIHGSSPEVVAQIYNVSRKTLFWLDAHWQGREDLMDELDPKYGQCPLMMELSVILGKQGPYAKKPVFMIDDISIFCSNDWWHKYGKVFDANQWPAFEQIYDRLHPNYRILIQDEILYAW